MIRDTAAASFWEAAAKAAATVSAAIFAGGTLVIGTAIGSRWQTMDPIVWMDGFFAEWLRLTLVLAPFFLLSFIALVASRRADRHLPTARRWWTVAIALWAANTAITSTYHLPEALRLRSATYAAEQAAASLDLWLGLHVPRIVLAFAVAIIAATIVSVGASRRPELR